MTDASLLLEKAADGDARAMDELLSLHRNRLKRMVAVRMDRRMAARIDPSDVVQESLSQAAREFPSYVETRAVAFYPWLRQIAWQCLSKMHRHHIQTSKRSTAREHDFERTLPNDSVIELIDRFVAPGDSPTQQVVKMEMQRRVREALKRMKKYDREILVLRYLEQLSMHEIAQVLEISNSAVRKRHVRALHRLQDVLDFDTEDRAG